jgi:hypothetical protein
VNFTVICSISLELRVCEKGKILGGDGVFGGSNSFLKLAYEVEQIQGIFKF